MRVLPMFPLGTVLLPHMLLPLHVFEPRYRAMVQDLLDGDGQFGVVLIERGHEVGGGDTRASLGTVARVLETQELDDGRWLLIALGTERLRVATWLPDDPYPRATVETLADPPSARGDAALRDQVAQRLRRYLALRAELGEPAAPATTELEPDPVAASYQMTVLAGLGPADTQELLAADTTTQRLQRLDHELRDATEMLQLQLAVPMDDPDHGGNDDGPRSSP